MFDLDNLRPIKKVKEDLEDKRRFVKRLVTMKTGYTDKSIAERRQRLVDLVEDAQKRLDAFDNDLARADELLPAAEEAVEKLEQELIVVQHAAKIRRLRKAKAAIADLEAAEAEK